MNDALNTTQAVTGDRIAPGLARLVKQGVLACALACTAFGAMAQDRNQRREDAQQQQQMRERFEARSQDPRFDRSYEMRERERAEQQMRDEGRRRMTQDEKRELKRQINEANMEMPPNLRRR